MCGIKYVYMGDTLGGRPDSQLCYKDGKVDYEIVRVQPFFYEGIRRLKDAWNLDLTIVLLCSERKPEMCHRSKLIGESLRTSDIEVMHIDENDQTPAKYGVRGIPTLILFKGGEVEGTSVGALTKQQLSTFLDEHL